MRGKFSAKTCLATKQCLQQAREGYYFGCGVGEKLGQPKSTSGFSLPRAFLCTTPFLEIWDNHFCPWESVGCALGGFGFKILGFDPAQKKKKILLTCWASQMRPCQRQQPHLSFHPDLSSARWGGEYKLAVMKPLHIPPVCFGNHGIGNSHFPWVQLQVLSVLKPCVLVHTNVLSKGWKYK